MATIKTLKPVYTHHLLIERTVLTRTSVSIERGVICKAPFEVYRMAVCAIHYCATVYPTHNVSIILVI